MLPNKCVLAAQTVMRSSSYQLTHTHMCTRARTHRSKILVLKQVMLLSKYVLWLDSDAIITRFDIPLLPYFLNLTNGKDAVFSSEFDQSLNARDQLLEYR